MKPIGKALVCGILLGTCAYAGSAVAQQSFSSLTCRAGTMSGLAKAEGLVVFSIDQRGVTMAEDAAKAFDNYTQRCIGSVAVIRGQPTGSGFCRNVDPANGDATIVQWNSGAKPGTGTFKFIAGTGKWQGITGGGDYQSAGVTRPVDEGTYQNCIRVKGTFSVPKM